MKNFLLLLILGFNQLNLSAQSFVSINPDSAMPGQTLNTVITGENFFFTMASSPNTWGFLEMRQGASSYIPNSVIVNDDDHLTVNWTIPGNEPLGYHEVNWVVTTSWGTFVLSSVPNGFHIGGCAPPSATITTTTSPLFCFPGSVTLNANTGTGLTYQWYRYNNLIPGATNSSYISTVSGNYEVVVTNATGCTKTSSVTEVRVFTKPDAVVSTSGDAEFCPSSTKFIFANTGTGLSYQWYRNGTTISGAIGAGHFAAQQGYYKVRVTNAGGCTKISQALFVDKLAPQPAVVTPLGPTTFCPGDNVTLSANTGSSLSYQWTKNNNIIPGATANTYIAGNSGAYRVIVTNADGCFKKSAKVSVDATCRLAANVSEEIRISPNPVHDQLTIDGVENATVTVISTSGKVVKIFENISGPLSVNGLPPGIYVLRITENGKMLFRKFVKL